MIAKMMLWVAGILTFTFLVLPVMILLGSAAWTYAFLWSMGF